MSVSLFPLSRATKADNKRIVERLLVDYNVTPFSNDLKTGESALHIACKNSSDLRFYITQKCQDLIFSVDTNGENPLHVACHMNDLNQRVLEKIENETLPSSLSASSFMSLQLDQLERPKGVFQSMNSHPNFNWINSDSATSSSNNSLAHRQLPLFEEAEEYEEQSPVQHPLSVMLRDTESNSEPDLVDSGLTDSGASGPSDGPQEEEEEEDHPLTLIMRSKASRRSVKVISKEGQYIELIGGGGGGGGREGGSDSFSNIQSLKRHQVNLEELEASTCSLSDNPLIASPPPLEDVTVASVSEYSDSTMDTVRNDITSGYESYTTVDSRRHDQAVMPRKKIPIAKGRKRMNSEELPSSPHRLVSNFENSSNSDVSTLLDSTSEVLKSMTFSHGPSPFTLDTILSVHMRLFSVSANGSSVLHITARNGHVDLLLLITQVAKYLEHNPDGADLTVLIRKTSSIRTPLEEAIDKNESNCLRILMNFASKTSVFEAIYNDSSLLQRAVKVESLDCLKVLCDYGLWRDAKESLVTITKKLPTDSMFGRYLMFYHIQLTLSMLCSRVKRNGNITIDSGVLRWNDLELEDINLLWLTDASVAISTVSHAFRTMPVSQPLQQNKEFFQKLGLACSEYFNSYMWQPQAHPTAWALLPITEIDLSSNRLEGVLPEIFQIKTLILLNLSHNRLVALPSNFNVQSPIYTCQSLKKLNVSHNCLVTLPEDLFYAVGNSLEELNARNNSLESLPPGLWVCTKLSNVNLSHNKLSQLHYFSDSKYFFDQAYSRTLINSMQLDQGMLLNSGKMSEEDFMGVMNYATRLNIFYHTLSHLLPATFESGPAPHYLQQVIDIHWLRTKLNNSQSTSFEYFEVSLPPDESLAITHLDLSYNSFSELPKDLPCIAPHLEKLDLRGNSIKNLDIVRDMPSEVASINLSSNKISSVHYQYKAHVCMNPLKLLDGCVLDPKESRFCRHKSHCVLDKLTNLVLHDNSIEFFNCIPQEDSIGGASISASLQSFDKEECQAYFPHLSVLSLEHNSLLCVPNGIQYLTQLSSLSLSHNSLITYLPTVMGLMNPQVLLILKLDGVSPKNIDPKLLTKPGARAIITYLKSLYHK